MAVDDPGLVAEIVRRLGPAATAADQASVHAADVALAVACLAEEREAIASVEALLAHEVARATPLTGATRDQAADVQAELRRILFVSEPQRPAALREYSGRGALRGYVRVMAVRALARVVNKGRREVALDLDLVERIAPDTDPELAMLRERYHDTVDDAFRAALAALDARTRALLRYQFVHAWNVDKVGTAYGVHRATAARWLAAAREELALKVREELATRLSVTHDDVDSIVRLVASRLELSLARLLESAPV